MSIPNPRGFPHREPLVIEVQGLLAMFRRPSSASNRVTYMIPTPTALRGMLKGVYHSNALFPIPLRVEYLARPRTQSISQTMHRNSVLGENAKFEGNPQGAVYLLDPHFRVHFEVLALEPKKVRTLRRRLAAGAFENPPFLGTRECGVDITLPTDAPVQDDVFLIEPRMFVGHACGYVEANKGVATYPRWALDALFDTRDQRVLEASHAAV